MGADASGGPEALGSPSMLSVALQRLDPDLPLPEYARASVTRGST